MKLHLDTRILKLKPFVSKDTTRISLCHLLFEDNSVVACNGYVLVIMPLVPNIEYSADKDEKLLIPMKFIENCLNLTRNVDSISKRKVIDIICDEYPKVWCTVNTELGQITLQCNSGDCIYPNYKEVINTINQKKGIFSIGFDPEYMANLNKLLPGGTLGWRFMFYGEGKAIKFYRNDYGVNGIIMPMNISE